MLRVIQKIQYSHHHKPHRCVGFIQTILRGPQHTAFDRDYTVDTCVRKDRYECEFRSGITSETLPRRVASRWKICADSGNRLAQKVLPGVWVLFEVPVPQKICGWVAPCLTPSGRWLAADCMQDLHKRCPTHLTNHNPTHPNTPTH